MMKTSSAARQGALRNRRTSLWTPFLALCFAVAHQTAGAFETWQPQAGWRIGQGAAAPWAPERTGVPPAGGLAGQVVRFEADSVAAPGPLACSKAHYEYVLTPSQGLFQGMLSPPADQTARALGIPHLPVLTLRVTCDSGVFDYHLISSGKALLGLDNVVWPLVRDTDDDTPEATAVEMLRVHMTHDMGFTPATAARKRTFLTSGLQGAIAAYFKRPVPKDEVPTIDGDPFTNTQEYPTHFVPGRASIEGARATVPVRLGDGSRSWQVEILLRRVGARWQVDDLLYRDGATLRGLLKPERR